MARANRHHIPGQVWHITHRCQKREFLLKFSMDRRRWQQWLFEAKKRYKLQVLDFVVASNHIHLLVVDSDKDVIPNSLQLITGRTAQEFNKRKKRKETKGQVSNCSIKNVMIEYSNDNGGLLQSSSVSVYLLEDYTRDGAGQLTSLLHTLPSTGQDSYQYDSVGQLLDADKNNAIRHYSYDAVGNRLSLEHDGDSDSYTLDAQSNQLLAITTLRVASTMPRVTPCNFPPRTLMPCNSPTPKVASCSLLTTATCSPTISTTATIF